MAADGSIVVRADIDDKQAQTELKKLEKQIDTLNNKISDKQQEKMPLVEEAKKAAAYLDEAKKKLDDMQSGEEFFPAASVKAQAETVKSLQKDFDSAQKKVEAMDASISKETIKLNRMKDAAAEYQARLAGAKNNFNGISSATDAANKHLEKFTNRIIGLARRVFVFTLITKALRSIKDYMWSAIQTNEEAMASVARLQGALRTLAQPILNVLIPAFTVLVNVITRVINALSRLISMIFGTTAEASAKAAKNLYAEQKALKGVGSAAKKAGQSLAAFDEINTLSSSNSSGGGTSTGITPNFSSMVSDGLSAILELFTGAALLALGAILTFSGANIPIGIALMSIGALAIWDAVTTTPGLANQLVESGLASAMEIIGGMIAVIGVILIIYGHIAAGIGLVLSGIALFAVGSGAKSDGDFAENVKSRLVTAANIIGECIAVIGVCLVVSGQLALGIGMIIAGAAIFAVSEFAGQEGALQDKIVSSLGRTAQAIGPLIAVLGVALLFMGKIPLGAALLISGIALFTAGAVALNWDLLKQNIVIGLANVLGAIGPYIAVLGLFLLFVPGMLPYGVGMLIAGIGMFSISKVVPNWNAILDKLKEVWASIKNWWNANCAEVFTGKYWKQVGADMVDSFLSGLKKKFEAVKSFLSSAKAWVSNKLSGGYAGGGAGRSSFAATQSISPDLAKNFKVPALATGAVIPPNREFLAVLGDQKSGTNIEAPLATIVDAFKQAMAESDMGGTMTFVVNLDGKEVARNTVNHINRMTLAAGKSVLKI